MKKENLYFPHYCLLEGIYHVFTLCLKRSVLVLTATEVYQQNCS